jgi:hypothetical protein
MTLLGSPALSALLDPLSRNPAIAEGVADLIGLLNP